MQVGDAVKCDKGDGLIVKVESMRARVKLNSDESTIWRELSKLTLLAQPTDTKMKPPLPPPPPPAAMLSFPPLPPEPKVADLQNAKLTLKHIESKLDRSAPVIEKGTQIHKSAMPDVLGDIQSKDPRHLKPTTTLDKSAPAIPNELKTRFDVRSSMLIELKTGTGHQKLMMNDATLKKVQKEEVHEVRRPTMSAVPKVLKFDNPNLDMFIIKRTLGAGNFGQVRLVQERESGTHYALKIMKKSEIMALKEVDHVKNEKNLLQLVNHPFLVNMVGAFHDPRNLYLIMEYVPGGDLWSVRTSQPTKRFVPDTARFYAGQVVIALEYLHSLGIVYRDLKPENILCASDGYLKIGDFGSAKVIESVSRSMCGTPEYQPPEIINRKGHNRAVDYWTLGILIFELLTGKTPFYDQTPFGIYKKILSGELSFKKFKDTIDADAEDIITKLLATEPNERLGMGSIDDIKRHKWFQNLDWNRLAQKKIKPQFTFPVGADGDTSHFKPHADADFLAGPIVNTDAFADIFQ